MSILAGIIRLREEVKSKSRDSCMKYLCLMYLDETAGLNVPQDAIDKGIAEFRAYFARRRRARFEPIENIETLVESTSTAERAIAFFLSVVIFSLTGVAKRPSNFTVRPSAPRSRSCCASKIALNRPSRAWFHPVSRTKSCTLAFV